MYPQPTILADMTSASTHEKFSLMLQERLDGEVGELCRDVKDLTRALHDIRDTLRDIQLSHKQWYMRSYISYYMQIFTNDITSPMHYLRKLHEDILEFRARNNDIIVGVGSERDADVLARPFLRGRCTNTNTNTNSTVIDGHIQTHNQTHNMYAGELNDLLTDIARWCAGASNDMLLEFLIYAQDLPDLIGDE
jgi:ABC-type molybdate transport system ATPase subunit